MIEVRIEISVDGMETWSPSPKGEAAWPWGVFPVEFKVEPGGGGAAYAVLPGGATHVRVTVLDRP